jgi:hypothetical protein
MKLTKLFPLVAILVAATGQAQVQNRIDIPDIKGYKTLQCDFHIHTVFSDGLVWPTVRVDEAFCEGLDAIAITDHLEYQPHSKDIVASHNRSYEIAKSSANHYGIILIKGAEITRSMPPGHFNALFLSDCDALVKDDWHDAFAEAKKQNAFITWNHPGWDAQQPDTTVWMKEHTEIYNQGWMNGIEVVNEHSYYEEVFQWALDKKLTMMGNSDIHEPVQTSFPPADGEHRPMTLVFAKERSAEGIREALDNRRTAVYHKDFLIGEEQYLRPIFDNSIEITGTKRDGNQITISFLNKSGLTFFLKKTAHDKNVVYFRDFEIKPHCRYSVAIKLKDNNDGKFNFEVTNLLVKPGKGLQCSYNLN